MRTVVDSVEQASGPPENEAELERELGELRERYPGAVFERYLQFVPSVHPTAFVAPGAVLIGRVQLHDHSSVWPTAVLRADINRIEIGPRSNVQDGTVVHLGDHDPTTIAEDVVVGHRAVLHGCHVAAGCLVGIGAIVLDNARVGEGSIIGAGALVTSGTVIPPRSLVLGAPGKVIKTLSAQDEKTHRMLAGKYVRIANNYSVG